MTAQIDKRTMARTPMRIPVELTHRTFDTMQFEGTSVDISPRGMLLEMELPVHTGDDLILSFGFGTRRGTEVPAVVKWSAETKDTKKYRAGCVFIVRQPKSI
ncbi:MAG: PilZ domain-containing protein [Spirochaetota bacterium]